MLSLDINVKFVELELIAQLQGGAAYVAST